MVQRHGDTFQTLSSSDGVHYMLISGPVHTIVMPTTLLAGMGVASGTPTATTTAVYQEPPDRSAGHDIRRAERSIHVPRAGAATTSGPDHRSVMRPWSNGVWTISGGGEGINLAADGIGNNLIADQFHYVYRTMGGDEIVSGRLTSIANGSATAQATLMMRADTSMGSPFYGVVVTPNGRGDASSGGPTTASSSARRFPSARSRSDVVPDQSIHRHNPDSCGDVLQPAHVDQRDDLDRGQRFDCRAQSRRDATRRDRRVLRPCPRRSTVSKWDNVAADHRQHAASGRVPPGLHVPGRRQRLRARAARSSAARHRWTVRRRRLRHLGRVRRLPFVSKTSPATGR